MISSRDTPVRSARAGQMPGLRRAQCALPPLNKCEGNLESRRRGLSLVRLPAGRLAAGACPPGSWTRSGRWGRTGTAAPIPAEADHPVIAPTAQIAGNFLAMEVIRLLLSLTVQTGARAADVDGWIGWGIRFWALRGL